MKKRNRDIFLSNPNQGVNVGISHLKFLLCSFLVDLFFRHLYT